MATVPLPMQWEFLTLLDYTIVMQVEDFNLMQKWPEQTSHLDAFRKPFSPTVRLRIRVHLHRVHIPPVLHIASSAGLVLLCFDGLCGHSLYGRRYVHRAKMEERPKDD